MKASEIEKNGYDSVLVDILTVLKVDTETDVTKIYKWWKAEGIKKYIRLKSVLNSADTAIEKREDIFMTLQADITEKLKG